MSCSADYYIVFWSGSADYYVVRHTCLRWRGWGEPTQTKEQTLLYSALYTGTPYVSSEQLTHKKCAKMYFCKHWQHLLVGAEVRVAPTSMC